MFVYYHFDPLPVGILGYMGVIMACIMAQASGLSWELRVETQHTPQLETTSLFTRVS